jgi:hypothetical protein
MKATVHEALGVLTQEHPDVSRAVFLLNVADTEPIPSASYRAQVLEEAVLVVEALGLLRPALGRTIAQAIRNRKDKAPSVLSSRGGS